MGFPTLPGDPQDLTALTRNLALCLIYGFGLGEVVRVHPSFAFGLKLVGIVYLLYLAWKIGTSGAIGEKALGIGLGFWSGIGFQWINLDEDIFRAAADSYRALRPDLEESRAQGTRLRSRSWRSARAARWTRSGLRGKSHPVHISRT